MKLIICIITLMIFGCATAPPVCRHNALATAILQAEEGKEVRIIAYQTTNFRHAEAQVKIHNEWQFIHQDCKLIELSTRPEYQGSDIHYYDLHEYLLRIGIKAKF